MVTLVVTLTLTHFIAHFCWRLEHWGLEAVVVTLGVSNEAYSRHVIESFQLVGSKVLPPLTFPLLPPLFSSLVDSSLTGLYRFG